MRALTQSRLGVNRPVKSIKYRPQTLVIPQFGALSMSLMRAYDELIDFIAGGSSPRDVADFRPSEATRLRVWELVAREKESRLTSDETSELNHYMELEHLMRLAKARARRLLRDE